MGWKSLEAQREYTRKWRSRNRDKCRAYAKKWSDNPNNLIKKHHYQKLSFDKKREWVNSFKKECVICGENEPISLSFHHTEPKDKSFTISTARARNLSYDIILKEINKCVVLCHNCHAKVEHFGGVWV